MIKVSVIMSVYNSERFLPKALESIMNQTLKDFELIIFDDASTDSTKGFLHKFAEHNPNVIVRFNKENLGLTKNLNRAISIAQGIYIARMDADDIALPTRLEKQVSFLDANKSIDILGSAALDIDEDGKELQLRRSPERHHQIIKLLPKANPMTHSTVMFRKDRLAQINFYNESYRTTQDYEMWFRAAGKGMKFHNFQEVYLKYRMDNNYYKRKSFTYRLFDCKLRLQGFKHINLPMYKYYYALIPLILGLLPEGLYNSIKKIDPRVNEID